MKGKTMTATKQTRLTDITDHDIDNGDGATQTAYRLCSERGGDGLRSTINQWGAWSWTVEELEAELRRDMEATNAD